ncbi:unnamed protein product [Onchocerca flexuosa]|uniref:GAGA-binding transcriptional activator n=1 Tax=Onchocerca flexuosa TaxID=387005 RepID=A0A183HE31_9BILA|nr:unnamed protein product [Onchocerca flexuosa]
MKLNERKWVDKMIDDDGTSSSLPFSGAVFYSSVTELGGDDSSESMDMDRLLQRTMILSSDTDFTANRILQRVPMNLMNGSSQGLASTSMAGMYQSYLTWDNYVSLSQERTGPFLGRDMKARSQVIE